MKRSATLTAVVAVLVLAGCSEATDGSPRSSAPRVPGGTSKVIVAEPIDPCEGAAGTCTYVADVDVDGDGNTDQVGVAHDSGSTQVIVGINGQRYEWSQSLTTTNAYSDPVEIYRGAFALSRAQGSDLALHLVPGHGNSEQFAVISWDGTNLTALPQPPTADQQGAREAGIWYLRSSHGSQDSIACRAPGEVAVVRLAAATMEGIPVPGGGRREEDFYLFSGGQWQPNGSDNVVDTSFSYSWDAHTDAFDCTDLGVAP